MSNFTIDAAYPWLFLLLIPALALTLFPYFRVQKKYRRTRNRIVSMVLHMCIMFLCISVLAGMTFSYEVPNKENEILLVVDMSDSGTEKAAERNSFVRSVIANSDPRFRLGVVTFGYDQVYAAPLTDDTSSVYDDYINAELPNTTATDIAAALEYASGLFSHPETAKIVLISDGVQTDGNATAVIRAITNQKTRIDTVSIPSSHGNEAEIIGVELPEQNVSFGTPFTVSVDVQSSYADRALITMYDNGEQCASAEVDTINGVQTVNLTHTFTENPFHELRFVLHGSNGVNSPVGAEDMTENNTFYSYIYVNEFNKILLIEREEGASNAFVTALDNQYVPDVIRVDDSESMPQTIEELRKYDQVVLFNISNAEMSEDFVSILEQYVHEIGGGLFTVGGDRVTPTGDVEANAYNRTDMLKGSPLYPQMLPVQAINYTPPLAVMIIIDRSQSMMTPMSNSTTRLGAAKEGALSCLNALTERDFCGVMTLEDDYSSEIDLTPATQRSKIAAAINNIGEDGGGTVYAKAIQRAGAALKTVNVEHRHIILVSDAEPGDSYKEYSKAIEENYKEGITFSIVAVTNSNETDMKNAVEAGGGRYYYTTDPTTLSPIMREDLKVPEITEISPDPFTPQMNLASTICNGIDPETMPSLNGYYGTKIKDGAEQPLKGEFVPIYAQWKYGKGMVGSFMCDLEGKWSADFLDSATGKLILSNILKTLFPTSDIRSKPIEAEFAEDNYRTRVSIYTDQLKSGEKLEVAVTAPAASGETGKTTTYSFGASDNYSRVTFETFTPGVYTIDIRRYDASGELTAETTVRKVFSYSKEYDVFVDEEEGEGLLADIADIGKGTVISAEEPESVFGQVVRTLKKTIDPRIAFIIIAIVLFLLDIAVRKFKFKWIHELIREHKAKKQMQNGGKQ